MVFEGGQRQSQTTFSGGGSKAFSQGALFSSQDAYQQDPEPSLPEPTAEPPEPISFSFLPKIPKLLEDTGLAQIIVEELIFKLLLAKGTMSGREIAEDVCLHFTVVEPILSDLKARLFVAHKSNVGMGDFIYILTESGQEKALAARDICSYAGSAPVRFDDYLNAVSAQSIRTENPGYDTLKQAFADMIFDPALFNTLGPAINSGRGLFLYGEPGNGKTTIAEKIAQCFQQNIFIPKTLWVEGQLVQLYDPQNHELAEESGQSLIPRYDQRWVLIKRPTVVVGGELTLDALEIKYNPTLKLSEAPLQMKANGGVFLIDDFGRQRVSHTDLLNRWIVPLEKRVDYLVLPNGQKITVPFDELIIFSTNLDPAQLVDEAFLRRIPYKIHVQNPVESHFRQIFSLLCPRYGIPYDDAMLDYLVENHYRNKRPFRGCQPRDILDQMVNMASYQGNQPVMNKATIDLACQNYFTVMKNQS